MFARREPIPPASPREEWQILEPLVPRVKPGVRPRTHLTRELLDAFFYV
jgi:transposase